MFCDLVGSTSLASRLDPEDMRQVIHRYQQAASAAIHRYEGYVARFLGDGIMAYFGYPTAHENDAERALYAGLAVVDAVTELNDDPDHVAGVEYSVRVGIATGLAVVGDLIGAGSAAEEKAVVGETPNLAARLQTIALPNSVVIGPQSELLVRGLFQLEYLGNHELKGIATPVAAWRVDQARESASRFEAKRGRELPPLVARRHELNTLLDRWQSARQGQGQAVLICAESGVGKSRLTAALTTALAKERMLRLQLQCSPFHTNTALYPYVQLIEKLAGIRRDEGNTERLRKLEAALAPASDDVETVPLIAELISISTTQHYPTLTMSPEDKKRKTLQLLINLFVRQTRRRPILLIFEDLHWIDPTSRELLDRFMETLTGLPSLLVVTHRPTPEARWPDARHVTFIHLNRLSRESSEEIVQQTAHRKPLPKVVVDSIIAKTDGIPLFVEELTKTVIESGMLVETNDTYALRGPLPALAIPETLHESLVARLGRQAQVKEIAQIGAVLGREFSYELLAAVSGFDEDRIDHALTQLHASEILSASGTPPKAVYQYRHALIQEAAYESLLRSRRRELHAHVAAVLEADFPSQAQLEPEIVAYHYTKADKAEAAIRFWAEAAKRALERSANIEVIAHTRQALALLERLPKSNTRDHFELQLRVLLGAAYRATKGFGSKEVEDAFIRARELCDDVNDAQLLMDTLRGLYGVYYVRGEIRRALTQAEQVVTLGKQSDSKSALMVGHWMRGCIRFWHGDMLDSRKDLETAIALYDPTDQATRTLSGQIDPNLSALIHLIWTLWILGYPDQSTTVAQRALDTARDLAQPFGRAMALYWASTTRLCSGHTEIAADMLPELRELTDRYEIAYLGSCATINEGLVDIQAGHISPGLAKIEQAFIEFSSQGASLGRPWAVSLPVSTLIEFGKTQKAHALLNDAFNMIKRNDEHQWEAELLRLQGDLLGVEHDPFGALNTYRQASSIARNQGAKSIELRIAVSRARILQEQRQFAEAYEQLRTLYEWFSEGFNTSDLQVAKQLLSELQQAV